MDRSSAYKARGWVKGKREMQPNRLFLVLVCGMTFIISGCCGSPWRVGIWRDVPTTVTAQNACDSCGQMSCSGDCTGHGFATWYPGKHIIRGFHHACGLFTCYGCGGNCWDGGACNAYGVSGWNPFVGEVPIENQLEPIPAPSEKANTTPPEPKSLPTK